MRITILYDNTTWVKGLRPDWGFSCLIEAYNRKILFDTGANGFILLENMEKLGITPSQIEEVFISHAHWDHTGGLSGFLAENPTRVYIPASCPEPTSAKETISVKEAMKLHDNIFSTGELQYIEQSLVVETAKGLIIIAGCSHPGVRHILESSSQFGKPYAVIGGLHGFRDFGLIENLEILCPTHCTQYIQEIQSLYPDKYVPGGAGKVIDFEP